MDDLDLRILDTERRQWLTQGPKEQHIRDVVGVSVTRYYQRLAALLDDPEAVAYAPLVIHRLRDRRVRGSR